MNRFSLTIFILFLQIGFCYSQHPIPDSIKSLLAKGNKTEKTNMLIKIAEQLVDSAIYHDEAKKYLLEAYTYSEESEDTIQQIKILLFFGTNEYSVGNYELSTDYYYRALKLAEKISDKGLIAKVNHNLGMVYDEMEEYDEAIDFYRRSLSYDELQGDTLGIIRSYINLSIGFQNKANLDEAQKYCDKAYDLVIQKNDSALLAAIVNNMGTIAYDKKEYAKSLEYYQKGLLLYTALNEKDGVAMSYNNLGLVYLDTKDYPKAKIYFLKALKLAQELDLYDFSGDVFCNLKFYYEETGDYKNALYYYDKYTEVYDSLIGEKKNKQIRQLQAKYDAEKRQNQILQLEKTAESQKVVIKNVKAVQVYLIVITVLALLLLFWMIYMFRNEKKLTKELQEKTHTLKKLNASKDKFFSIIAHDLRNPFHALFSYTSLLKNGLDEFSKEEVTQILSDLHDATDQGFNLLQNLLFWTRSQSNRIHIFRSKFEMETIVEEVINLARPNALKKGQQLLVSIMGDCTVHADKDMVSTILRNLIFNAIKFSGHDKKIRVEVSCESPMVLVKVIDEGVGMSEKVMKKLFVIDDHLSTIGTDGELGSGLGLILCKEFAEKNDGQIEVKSQLGKGSEFSLRLPCLTTPSKNELSKPPKKLIKLPVE